LFFEDVVTEQDDPAYSWEEADHGQRQFTFFSSTLLTLNALDEVDHADPTLTGDEELHTHKVESTFDEQGSVLG
jgi:hypothetical protein